MASQVVVTTSEAHKSPDVIFVEEVSMGSLSG